MSDSSRSGINDQAPPPTIGPITLQVGERRFTTLSSTLSDGSPFFASLLSNRWINSQSEDGSYFVDADPDLFVHILRYLRRGVLPILYDRLHGFDHVLYEALLKEAEYFGITPLCRWIEEKRYLLTVQIQYSMKEMDWPNLAEIIDENTEGWFYLFWRPVRTYQCPRNIYSHHGNSDRCGRACERAKGEGGDVYTKSDVLKTFVVLKKTIFTKASDMRDV